MPAWIQITGAEVIELDEQTDPSQLSDSQIRSATTISTLTSHVQLHVQNDQPDSVKPKSDSMLTLESSIHSNMSNVKEVPYNDDITFVEDVDIFLVIPTKLRHLEYPRVEDSHDKSVAKAIRKKFSKLGIEETSKDVLAFLSSEQQHSSYTSWRERIEEATNEEENDAFWENVPR